MAKGKYKQKRLRQQRKSIPIHESGLSNRVIRVLQTHGICTMYDLDTISDSALKDISGVGEKTISEIHAAQLQAHPQNTCREQT